MSRHVPEQDKTSSGDTENKLETIISSMITNGMTHHSNTSLLTFIRHNLKYATIMKFTGSLASSKLPRSGVQGYDSSEVAVSTLCDMDSFIAITQTTTLLGTGASSSIHSQAPPILSESPTVRFNPSRRAFLQPSRATSSISVDLTRLSEILWLTQIRDTQDHSTIGVKECNGKTSHLLRLLGSSCTVTIKATSTGESNNAESIDVDCVLPLQSCTANFKHRIKVFLQSVYVKEKGNVYGTEDHTGTDPLFYRFRENYDDAQGRFLSPWKAAIIDNSCFQSSSTIGTEELNSDDSTFSVEWCQNTLTRHNTWTSDASYFGQQVLGHLTAFFPCITFFGDATISEIQNLIKNYLL